jgi:hypothetical protein
MAHDVFISYSSEDKPVGDAICATLESKGVRCWIAPRDVVPGQDWGNSIVQAIATARVMVLVFSSHANDSPHVKREVERAVHHGLVIVPFRIEDVVPGSNLEYFLGTPHWLDALTPPLEAHLERLAGVVLSFLTGQAPPPLPARRARWIERRMGRFALIGTGLLAIVLAVVLVVALQPGGKRAGTSGTTASGTNLPPTSKIAGTSTTMSGTSTTVSGTSTPVSAGTTMNTRATVATGATSTGSSSTRSTGATGTGTSASSTPTGALSGSWQAQTLPTDLESWTLDLKPNGTYTEHIQLANQGSVSWQSQTGQVDPTKPFANLRTTLYAQLSASSGEGESATFTLIGSGTVDASGLVPNGFGTFFQEQDPSFAFGASYAGKMVNDHEWQTSLNVGGATWDLVFNATGPGYTLNALHTETGSWRASQGELQLVPSSGAESQMAYSSVTQTTFSVTLEGAVFTFVRTS